MLFLIQLLLFIHYVLADIPPQEVNQYTNGNNIIVASLYAMGVCSCASLLCKQKNKLKVNLIRVNSKFRPNKLNPMNHTRVSHFC